MKLSDFNISTFDKNKKIVIYGNDDYAHLISSCLERSGLKASFFISDAYSTEKNVIRISTLMEKNTPEEIDIIMAINAGYFNRVFKELESYGVKEVYICHSFLDNADYKQLNDNSEREVYFQRQWINYIPELSFINPKGLYIVSLDATVTTKCSLKCKDCSNLMQYYEHAENCDVDKLINDIHIILDRADGIGELRILGGEPFINQDFVRLLEEFENEKKIFSMGIYTNATIFPGEEILQKIKNSRVVIRISDYDELSRKKQDWIRWCEENKVRYFVEKYNEWQDLGPLKKHDYSEFELREVYSTCSCRSLPTVLDGKIYACPYSANAAKLKVMSEDEMKTDSIPIQDISSKTKKEIDYFLYGRRFLEACRYCQGRNPSKAAVKPHIQVKVPLKYEKPEIGRERTAYFAKETSKVSVIVPLYNMEKYIEKCLESIKNQTYRNLEVILLDDGSSDNTVAICEKIISSDTRFRIIKKEHEGITRTRVRGIMESSGENMIFVDADDWIEEDYVELFINELGDCDAVVGGHIDDDPEKISGGYLMDRGQNKYKYRPACIKSGIYEKETYPLFLEAVFDHSDKEYFTVPGFVWGVMWKTEKAKKIVSEWKEECDIWWGEDILFSHSYYLSSQKVKVVKYVGYHYCQRENTGKDYRYDAVNMFENTSRLYRLLLDKIRIHPMSDKLVHLLNKEYVFLLGNHLYRFVHENGLYEDPMGYYPYYGRLKGKHVILYGAGRVGKMYRRCILRDREMRLVAWVDKNHESLSHMGVEGLDKLVSTEYDYVIIGVGEKELAEQITEELTKLGVCDDKILWNPTMWKL